MIKCKDKCCNHCDEKEDCIIYLNTKMEYEKKIEEKKYNLQDRRLAPISNADFFEMGW